MKVCPGGVVGDPTANPSIGIVDAQASRITGFATNVDASQIRAVCYAITNRGYIQPDTIAWGTDICSDGSWETFTYPWGSVVCLLVDPSVFTPSPIVDTDPCKLDGVLACDVYPSVRTIMFSGYAWSVRDTQGYLQDPGPNYFSGSEANVAVDSAGDLHLKCLKQGELWRCPELYLPDAHGYGQYIYQLGSRVDDLVNPLVFSGFLYESIVPWREIDAEFSPYLVQKTCGDLGQPCAGDTAQYVVQPFTKSGNRDTWPMKAVSESTHRIVWSPDAIDFLSWEGFGSPPVPGDPAITRAWTYAGSDIPPSDGGERFRFNLWLVQGNPPADALEHEVVVHGFAYEPLSTTSTTSSSTSTSETTSTSSSSTSTTVVICGDGIREGAEECDQHDLSGCSPGQTTCTGECRCATAGICGNGIAEGGEECDGGDLRSCQACVPPGQPNECHCASVATTTSSSTSTSQPAPTATSTSTTTSVTLTPSSSTLPSTPGSTEPPWPAIPAFPATLPPPMFTTTVTFVGGTTTTTSTVPQSTCGNGTREGNEQCDDGNTVSGDCCSSTCQFENLGSQVCGQGDCQVTAAVCVNGARVTCVPGNPPEPGREVSCSDGRDNDCDGLVDAADPDCSGGTGIIDVFATLNGSAVAVSGVTVQLNGPTTLLKSGSLPMIFNNVPVGTYQLVSIMGVPGTWTLASVTPSNTQTLTGGGIVIFTDNFTAPPGSFALNQPSAGCPNKNPTIYLDWSDSTGAARYDLYRNGSFYINTALDSFFTNSANVAFGNTYSYFVRAVNNYGTVDSTGVSIKATCSAQVGNTGGIGLKLRECASTDDTACPKKAGMPDGTIVTIVGGPTTANGFTWYKVDGPYGSGWCVGVSLIPQ